MSEDDLMGSFLDGLAHWSMMQEAQASVALSQDPTVQTCTVDDEGNLTVADGGMSDEDAKKEAERRTQEERDKWDKRTK